VGVGVSEVGTEAAHFAKFAIMHAEAEIFLAQSLRLELLSRHLELLCRHKRKYRSCAQI